MKIHKVVVIGELPESCGRCIFLDMVYGNMCPLNDKIINDINTRPDWCPLVMLDIGRVYQWTGDELIDVLRSWMPPECPPHTLDE